MNSETEKDTTSAAQISSTEPSKADTDQPIPGSSMTVVAASGNTEGQSTLPAETKKEADAKGPTSEARKMGSFPGDLSSIKPVFSLKSKN